MDKNISTAESFGLDLGTEIVGVQFVDGFRHSLAVSKNVRVDLSAPIGEGEKAF